MFFVPLKMNSINLTISLNQCHSILFDRVIGKVKLNPEKYIFKNKYINDSFESIMLVKNKINE